MEREEGEELAQVILIKKRSWKIYKKYGDMWKESAVQLFVVLTEIEADWAAETATSRGEKAGGKSGEPAV